MGSYLNRPLVASNITDSQYHHPAQIDEAFLTALNTMIDAHVAAVAPQLEEYATDPEGATAECLEECIVDIFGWLSDRIGEGASVIILKD